jgi:hypothetical protein
MHDWLVVGHARAQQQTFPALGIKQEIPFQMKPGAVV